MAAPRAKTGDQNLAKQHKYPAGTHQLNFVYKQVLGHNLELGSEPGRDSCFLLTFKYSR